MKKKLNQKYIQRTLNALDKLERVEEEILKKTPQQLEKELNYIGESIITRWYDDYDRHIYEPYGSLYYAYQVKRNGTRITVTTSPDYISVGKHNQSDEIVYNNAFVRGYHGGSTGSGLDSLIPHWRTPYPFYPEWGGPAKKSKSPLEMMQEEMQGEVDKTLKEIDEKIANAMNRVITNLRHV